jgi:hypothetical protein
LFVKKIQEMALDATFKFQRLNMSHFKFIVQAVTEFLNIYHGCRKLRLTAVGDPWRWPRDTLYPQKVGTNFADMRRSLGQYSSLAD